METATKKTAITVETLVKAPVQKAWESYVEPKHITKWNQASPDWHCPAAENDLRKGGKYKATMAAKDGSFSFDFEATYTDVQTNKLIEYVITDGRKAKVVFTPNGNETKVTVTFEAEDQNPIEMQRGGWQAILDSYKNYTERL